MATEPKKTETTATASALGAPAASAKTAAPKMVKLRVKCVPGLPGRGRAGIRFSDVPTEVEVTEEQAVEIRNDAMLITMPVGAGEDFGDSDAEKQSMREEIASLKQRLADEVTARKAAEAQLKAR